MQQSQLQVAHIMNEIAMQLVTDLCHLWANTSSFSTQQFLLFLHLWIRLGPQVVRYNLMAKHWHTLFCKFLIEDND